MKEATYGHPLLFAFFIKVVMTKAASMVLRPRLKPNCSSPRRLLSSAAILIRPHIRTVTRRSKFEGMVIGRYCEGPREFPPCDDWEYISAIIMDTHSHLVDKQTLASV